MLICCYLEIEMSILPIAPSSNAASEHPRIPDGQPMPDENNKPIKPDPDEPYQPTEPDEPDVLPEIIGSEPKKTRQEKGWPSLSTFPQDPAFASTFSPPATRLPLYFQSMRSLGHRGIQAPAVL
jgi:hypothetical protein